MIKTVLLLRMVGFTTLFVVLALAVLVYQKASRRWLKFFLIYMGIEAVYSVSFTFVFYSHTYLSKSPSSPSIFFIIFQMVSSVGILYSAPRFLQELVLKKRGPVARYGILVMPASDEMRLSSLFYLYLLFFYLWAMLRHTHIVSRRWHRAMVVFVAGAILWHVLWVVELGLLHISLSEEGPLPSILLTNALWEVFWAAVVLVPVLGELKGHSDRMSDQQVPDEFRKEYGISRREAELIPLLCAGESSKSIGEALFISTRTVENHVHNIYRKCGVGKRLELVHLLNRYRS